MHIYVDYIPCICEIVHIFRYRVHVYIFIYDYYQLCRWR